jgi:uncharacterized surface protein with fasciclin (FAS1) repeats
MCIDIVMDPFRTIYAIEAKKGVPLMKKSTLKIVLGVSALALVAACGTTESSDPKPVTADVPAEVVETVEAPAEVGTIVGVAAGNPDFSTLVAAVQAAELVDTLNSDGPFTVFAPTNAAFGNLPEGTVATLLLPENKAQLQGVLTYHVVSGKVMASDVVAAITNGGGSFEATTVQGGTLTVSLDGDNVILTDENGGVSTVVATDVAASNGVIHVIDTVVLPG